MRVLFYFLCIVLLIGCNTGTKTTLTVNVKSDRDIPVNLFILGEKIPMQRQSEGVYLHEFDGPITDFIAINIDNYWSNMYVHEGEDFILDFELKFNDQNRMTSINIDTPSEFYNKILTYIINHGYASKVINTNDFMKKEENFKILITDIIHNNIEHLEQLDLPENFKRLQRAYIHTSLLAVLSDHQIGYTYLNQIDMDTYSMSDGCRKFIESYISDSSVAAESPSSLYHLLNMYLTKVEKIYSKDMEENMFQRIDYFKKFIKDQTLLEKLMFNEIVDRMQNQKINFSKKVPQTIASFENKTLRKRLENVYEISKLATSNEKAFNFTAEDINGNEKRLSDYEGKLTVIEVWASWCEPCLRGMPKYQEAQSNFHMKPVNFISLSIDDNEKAWKKKVAEIKLEGNVLRIKDKKTFMEKYGLFGVPATLIIDKNGNVLDGKAPRVDEHIFEPTINSYLK